MAVADLHLAPFAVIGKLIKVGAGGAERESHPRGGLPGAGRVEAHHAVQLDEEHSVKWQATCALEAAQLPRPPPDACSPVKPRLQRS
jgi:hypothetical protein